MLVAPSAVKSKGLVGLPLSEPPVSGSCRSSSQFIVPVEDDVVGRRSGRSLRKRSNGRLSALKVEEMSSITIIQWEGDGMRCKVLDGEGADGEGRICGCGNNGGAVRDGRSMSRGSVDIRDAGKLRVLCSWARDGGERRQGGVRYFQVVCRCRNRARGGGVDR